MQFIPGFQHEGDITEPAYSFFFQGDKLLVDQENGQFTIPRIDLAKPALIPVRKHYLGLLDGCPCYAGELAPDNVALSGMSFHGLRRFLGQMPEELFALAGRAYQIMNWDRTHQYCGRCGAQTENKMDERAKICPACGLINYPQISPAIIVAITRGKEILLARGSRFPAAFYSVLAGFVEPGETFEECVQREVGEEVGIKVKNIRYFGSQPWPFPNSLMVGFTAEYDSGEINIDENEILDAGWFTAENSPPIPGVGSIARRLIDAFVRNY